MSRIGRLVVLIAVLVGLGPAAAAADAPPRSTDFDDGWRFALVNRTGITDPTGAYANAADPAYDDSAWRTLDVPHDWSIELDPTTGPGTGTTSGTGFFQGGLGWYRKTFTLPAVRGRQADLGRVRRRLHGLAHLLQRRSRSARHPYGYTGFAVDLTALAHTDGDRRTSSRSRCSNQLPSSRWYSGSGIYRDVHLVVTDPVHVARHGVVRHHARPRRTTVRSGYAHVHVDTTVGQRRRRTPCGIVPHRARRGAGTCVAASRETGPRDLRVDAPAAVVDRGPAPLHPQDRAPGRAAASSTPTTTPFGIRWFRSTRTRASPSTASTARSRASTCTTTSARSARPSTATPC